MDNNLQRLDKKGCDITGAKIDISGPYKKERIGNKTWGVIDYLVRQGYRITGFHEGADYKPIFDKKGVEDGK